MSTFDRVRAILANRLHVSEEVVVPEASLEGDLGADSLDIAEIAMAMEDEFEFTNDAIEFSTVQEIVDYIEKRTSVLIES